MSERKVINKYYPPDFDPSQIVKKKKKVKTGSASLSTVRLMTPFSMKCTNCNEYISKSRKFNARKEVTNESYLGLKIIRFHIKCPRCASEILFRTDPKSAGYIMEFGAQKNYDSGNTNQILKEETVDETLSRLEKEEQEAKELELKKDKKQTTLEELEAKVNDMKRQQQAHDELEDIREKNKRLNDSRTIEQLKEKAEREHLERQKLENEEDEKLTKAAFENSKNQVFNQALKGSDTDNSDSDAYSQPLVTTLQKTKKVAVKRKPNLLGVSVKRTKR